MTVCIAAVCEPKVNDEYIVVASDRMVSMGGYFSGDNIVRKIDPIVYGWTSMIAGNDVSPAVPMLARVRQLRKEQPCPETQENLVDAFKSAYKYERLRMIEDEILSPMGFTWDTFRRDARSQLPDRTYEHLLERIRHYEVQLTFLVSGFDPKGNSHIFTVCNPGKCDYYGKLGFWAIGSGQHQAVASMFANCYSRHDPLEECVAKVLAAKITAESASGVGKSTWMTIECAEVRNRSIHIFPSTVGTFREAWARLPKLPPGAVATIFENVKMEKQRIETDSRATVPAPQPGE